MPDARPVSTILHARHVLTMDERDSILTDQAIVIDKGQILDILPQSRCHYRASEVVELPQHAVMPGLINAHTHAAMSLFRGLSDDLPLMSWLQEHIWPAEARWVNDAFVRDGSLLAMAEMLRSGTTCFSDMYFFPAVVAKAVGDVQMRAQLTFPVLDFPSAWARDADEYLHKGLQLHDDFRHHPLIQTGFGPHAPYTVSDGPLRKVAALAAETNSPVQIHLHETATEISDALRQDGRRPLQRLQELGLLSPQLQAVHMTQLDAGDIALLAQTGTHVIHCPESNLKLASGFCPVAQLLAAGVNVALGTDGAASNNDLDLFGEMRTAALLAKGVSGDPTALPATAALRMATINGARALGIDHLTGSLEPGKSADLIAIGLDDPACTPFYQLPSRLVYSTPSSQISDVWVVGKRLLHGRTLTTIDLPAVLTNARQWQQKIAEAQHR